MEIVCLDLEGVLLPEIWICFAERTGIAELRLTTRDVANYDELMKKRLAILKENRLGLREIEQVISGMNPLEGARDFLERLKTQFQVLVLSDTYYEFAAPLMVKLGSPTLFCHTLEVADDGTIVNYRLRQQDSKKMAVRALHDLNFRVVAVGDSYNDTNMLSEADAGILFRAPENVVEQFPRFPHTQTYEELRDRIQESAERIREGAPN
ncbi:MAG: bifunctional phosphoserine phosphatase/homoserine phosphotransferase ThrH [Deltaproteobacteria bacterium]|nr:bifunctional phosphoserine phosphatase/homoserine phosphotransferase ThrH [Deltaproteobacteria bacterium]